ncbi:MAG: FkbM family methyltransferase [bacterium]
MANLTRRLRSNDDNAAQLVVDHNAADRIRIAISEARSLAPHDIQFNVAGFQLRSGAEYELAFLARADRPRAMSFGVALAHAPWTNLGLYDSIELASEWRRFERRFFAGAPVDDARIHFDVGASDVSVELSALTLLDVAEAASLVPERASLDVPDVTRLTAVVAPRAARGQSPWDDAANIIAADVTLIFDVGANIGRTAREVSERFPDARVYCFEPVPATYAILEANTAALTNVSAAQHGFSDAESTTRIHLQEDRGWNSLSKNVDRGLGDVEIRLDTIDRFCREHAVSHINILKTDTEGHDLMVLRGATRMLSEGRIDAIYSEIGFYKEDAGHTYFCDLLTFLQAAGFQFTAMYDIEGLTYVSHDVEPCYPWANALFVRNDLVQAADAGEYSRWWAGIRPPVDHDGFTTSAQ